MADQRKFASTSNLIRFTLKNKTTGQGLTGLTGSTTGLIISTICDNEVSATVYTQAATHIQTITTLGTYSAPSASNCRFGEVDSTNHKGLYEFQFADARFSVSSSKKLIISVNDAEATILDADYEIQLVQFDPYDAVHLGLSAIPNTAVTVNASLLTSGTGTDQIHVDGAGNAYANVNKWLTGTIPAPNVTGIPKIDLVDILGNAPTTTTNGILDVNVKNYNNHIAVTDGNNLPEVDVVDISGSANTGAAGYVGIDWSAIHLPGSTVNLSGTIIPVSNTYIRQNTAQAGASGTITLDSGASASNNFYSNDIILLTGGTGIGQSRLIVSYVGSTKVATISPNWVTNPDNTSTFTVLPGGQNILAPVGLDQITAWSAALTARQALFLSAAGIFGQISGLPTSPATVLGLDAATTTAVVHFDSSNNRTSITLTLP